MSNGGYQSPIKKPPQSFEIAIVKLIKWRDSVKERRKAMAIQRVINKRINYAEEHGMMQGLYMFCVGCGFDLYGKKWGR